MGQKRWKGVLPWGHSRRWSSSVECMWSLCYLPRQVISAAPKCDGCRALMALSFVNMFLCSNIGHLKIIIFFINLQSHNWHIIFFLWHAGICPLDLPHFSLKLAIFTKNSKWNSQFPFSFFLFLTLVSQPILFSFLFPLTWYKRIMSLSSSLKSKMSPTFFDRLCEATVWRKIIHILCS